MPKENLADYTKAEEKIKQLFSTQEELKLKVEEYREARYLDLDVDSAKWSDVLNQDDLFVPIKLIDRNIRREQAKYINYIVGSRRTAILSSMQDPSKNTTLLEKDFTQRQRYDGWQVPFFACVDGAQHHGWGAMEVVFDRSKPGSFAIENVGHENLAFPKDCKNLATAPYLGRFLYYTKDELQDLVTTKDFKAGQVEKLLASFKDTSDKSLIKICKFFFKKDRVVYVGWAANTATDGWLKEPKPLSLGRLKPSQIKVNQIKWEFLSENKYPVILFPYIVSENPKIMDLKARGFLDEATQDACTSLMTSYVTASRRAAQVYASPKDGNGAEPLQTDVKLGGGTLISAPVNFWQMQAPDPAAAEAVQAMISDNAQENSGINYAAINRQDSRKTAREIGASQTEAQQLSAVQVAVFSIALREVLTIAFSIYHSRVIQGIIKLPPNIPITDFTQHVYKVAPSGDSDVIEREEKTSKMMASWPVMQMTGAKTLYLKNMISLLFPDEADEYNKAIEEDNQKTAVIQSLLKVVQGFVTDPTTGQPTQEAAPLMPQIAQLTQQAMASIGMPPQPTQNGKPHTSATNGAATGRGALSMA